MIDHRHFALVFIACMGAIAAARSENTGYVVKVESDTVYLDFRQASGASVGQKFAVYTEGAELKHPITGESLGREERTVAEGHIERIFPKYSIGRAEIRGTSHPLKAGQKARLEPMSSAAATSSVATESAASQSGSMRTPVWRSPNIDLDVTDIAMGDVDGDGTQEIFLSGPDRVQTYRNPSDDASWNSLCDFQIKSGARILSIEALDLNQDGKAEVFTTVQNSFFNRVETIILQCEDREFKKIALVPWMVRAYTDGNGKPQLAAQELINDVNFPLGAIYSLEYKDGKYVRAKSAIRLSRVDWVYGFAVAQASNPFHMFYTPTNRIRVQFKKGSWSSPETYGQTSKKIFWHDKPFQFYPRLLPVQSPEGLSGIYTVKNIASLGGLAGVFGVFSSAELHRLKWNGLGLEPDWKAPLSGYAADLVVRHDPNHGEETFVAVVNSGGRTSVWKFQN